RLNHVAHRHIGTLLELFEALHAPVGNDTAPAYEHRLVEAVLAAEVIVDQGLRDVGLGSHHAQRGARVAHFGEYLFGGIEDALGGIVARPAAPGTPGAAPRRAGGDF